MNVIRLMTRCLAGLIIVAPAACSCSDFARLAAKPSPSEGKQVSSFSHVAHGDGRSALYPVVVDGELRTLSAPILKCIVRTDTSNPAFHACIDWHSAIHATFALHAISRLTGQQSYQDVAEKAVGGQGAVAAAAQEVAEGGLSQELPYGFAWALILDTETRIEGSSEYTSLANAVSKQLLEWLNAASPQALISLASSQEYANSIWPMDALLIWARTTGQMAIVTSVENRGRSVLTPGVVAKICHSPSGAGTTGFFAPCSLVALFTWLTGVPSDHNSILKGLARYKILEPGQMTTIHSAGLNFSRTWGDIAAYGLTGDVVWLQREQKIFKSELTLKGVWDADYPDYSHWVAQFGVLTLWIGALPTSITR
jgi:hypothetical protein